MTQGGAKGLVVFAARQGLTKVCLFTASPVSQTGENLFPVVVPKEEQDFAALLDDNGISILNAEYFPVIPDKDVADYEPTLALAARLGAKRAISHIHERDPARAEDQLAALCSMAMQMDLEIGLEFTGFAPGCNSLDTAIKLHQKANQPNLTIAIDALHLFRTGGTMAQIQTLDPEVVGYAQLCDGPHLQQSTSYIEEAMNRMIPGEGQFPLAALIDQLGEQVDWDIEVPQYNYTPDFDPEKWAIRAIKASKKLL
ncbi:MAG: TIM barrel protein [Parasphingorhabdus sp.]|uniref:sugar phosphate isomerase/epimerase family protein n=1 Tax=Parasphingorhabdus sp. TaxID=2709688 RepID=UPI0032995BBB